VNKNTKATTPWPIESATVNYLDINARTIRSGTGDNVCRTLLVLAAS